MEASKSEVKNQPAPRWPFVRGDPNLPRYVRGYSAVLSGIGAAGIAIMVLGLATKILDVFFSTGRFEWRGRWQGGLRELGMIACWLGISVFVNRVGRGLRRGERPALYGVCVMPIGCIIWAGIAAVSDSQDNMMSAVLLFLLSAPLAVLAALNWRRFK